ncbi:MAG: DUF3575 domain-containing protein [Phocaeicola sp.]
MIKLRLLFCFVLLVGLNTVLGQSMAQAQKEKEHIILYFQFDKFTLDGDYLTNRTAFARLHELLENELLMSSLDSIQIRSYSSPEGPALYNEKLALKRAQALESYLREYKLKDFSIPLQLSSLGENWEGLSQMVLQDNNLPSRNEVLEILNSQDSFNKKEVRLKALHSGKPWKYISQTILPYLRGASCVVFFIDPLKVEELTPPVLVEEPILVEEPTEEPVKEVVTLVTPKMVRPLAAKTNLLFDLATILNVEVEVPIGRRFSVAGEWIFPWWLFENDQNCLEVLSGNLEARYWFKPNYSKQDPLLKKHNPLTGWFIGLYGGGGLYDLEWKREGYQGEFFIASGISGGYVMPLRRNFNMEFSLGLGVLRTKYRHYHAEYCDIDSRWHLIKQHSGTYTWVGPTKAKVSLVWYPHFNLKRKGGKL